MKIVWLVVCIAALLFVNLAVLKLTGFSPLYCWGGQIVGPIWDMWAEMLFALATLFFMGVLLVKRAFIPLSIGVMMVIASAPAFAKIIFGGGLSCH